MPVNNIKTTNLDNREVARVLYVDDEISNLHAFNAAFRREFKIITANSGQEGLEALKGSEKIHVVITDQRMPGMTGIEFLQQVKQKYPEAMRVLLTGYADINAVIDAINKGEVYRYVTKPWNFDELKNIVQSAYEVFHLREQNRILTEKLIRANEQLEFLLRQNLIS